MNAGSKAAADIATLLRSRNSLLWIVSREEVRVERLLVEAVQTAQYDLRFWDCATGVSTYDGSPQGPGAACTDPAAVLSVIRDTTDRAVYVLRDLPAWLRDPTVLRSARSLARSLPMAPREQARAIIVLTTSTDIPPELAGHAVVVEWPLPDREEIAQILDSALAKLPDEIRVTAAPNGCRDEAIDAAVGLSAEEVQGCYARSLVALKRIDPPTVAREKKRVLARERVLEWYDPLPGGLDSVGGLDQLKAWLVQRRAAIGQRAKAYGLPAPKGVLLVGVQGCGKSLCAKAIATAWGGIPLLRFDPGSLKSKFVGDSEANIRRSLKTAEAMAPCVLWLDEIEKSFAGATDGGADGGTSKDQLGYFLSWMQDHSGSVFVVATSNDVSALPPELLRKGRFDEMFFVDLPNREERAAIAKTAAYNQYQRKELLNFSAVADATDGFIGAEIAGIIADAMFVGFADGERSITTNDLLAAAKNVTPLSRTASEKIDSLRKWAKGRCRPATSPEVRSSEGGQLDV